MSIFLSPHPPEKTPPVRSGTAALLRMFVPGFLIVFQACRFSFPEAERPRPAYPEKWAGSVSGDGRAEPPALKMFFQDSLLRSLIDTALKRNFDLRQAEQRVLMGYAANAGMRGIRSPDLNFLAGSGVRRFGRYTIDGVGNYDTRFSPNLSPSQRISDPVADFNAGLFSSWEADLWGKLQALKKSARYRFLSSVQGRNFLATQTVAMVASAYYSQVALENERNIYEENIRLQVQALEAVQFQKQTGQANQLAVEIMEAQLLKSREKALQVDQRLILNRNHLLYLCGRFPDSLSVQAGELERQLEEIRLKGIPSEWLRFRPDFQEVSLEILASEADLKAAQAAFYPSFVLSAHMGAEAFRATALIDLPASLAFSALGGLAAPLANRRHLKARLMQSEAEKRSAYIRYEETVVRGFGEVFNALVSLGNVDGRIRLTTGEVEILKQAIQTSRDLFRTGRASYLEVHTAQVNALESQLELVELKRYRQQLCIELYRALGGGAGPQ